MKKLRFIKGIGEVDQKGEVVNKCQYEGAKGFKVVTNGMQKVVYLLETQRKLFDVPKDISLFFNEKAFVIPMKHIRFLIDLKYQAYFEEDNKVLGVFNSSGDLIALAQKVRLEQECFKAADKVGCGWKWGLYNYNGEELFPKEYIAIQAKTLNISGKNETVFSLSSSRGSALFSSDKRLLIPWEICDIIVKPRENSAIVWNWVNRRKNLYEFAFDLDGNLIAVSCSNENQSIKN